MKSFNPICDEFRQSVEDIAYDPPPPLSHLEGNHTFMQAHQINIPTKFVTVSVSWHIYIWVAQHADHKYKNETYEIKCNKNKIKIKKIMGGFTVDLGLNDDNAGFYAFMYFKDEYLNEMNEICRLLDDLRLLSDEHKA